MSHRFFRLGLLVGWAGLNLTLGFGQESPTGLKIIEHDGVTRVTIAIGEEKVLGSPPEGLWSIATDWEDRWPSQWRHAHPERVEESGEWTVLQGTIPMSGGEWRVRDAYRPEGSVIRCLRRFEFSKGSRLLSGTLHSRPAPVPYGNLPDQWWSMGVESTPGITELVMLSGPSASNGQRSVVKGWHTF